MTNQHTERKRTVAGIALAALVFSGALVSTGALAAQTAEEPQVVFRVRMVQAERAATDKLAAERVTLSKADFNTSETINVHILNETADVVALVNGEASRSTLDVLSVPTLSTRNGLEAKFLVGSRKEVPTEADLLAAGQEAQQTGEEAAKLPEHDFGMQLNFQPFILPNGKIRVRLRPRVTSVNYTDATLRGGRYVPSISTRQTDATYDVKPGQTIALTGLFNDEIVQQLRRSAGAADEPLLKQLIDARTAKTGTDLVLLVTPELIESSGPTR